jgi:hypothetical protein
MKVLVWSAHHTTYRREGYKATPSRMYRSAPDDPRHYLRKMRINANILPLQRDQVPARSHTEVLESFAFVKVLCNPLTIPHSSMGSCNSQLTKVPVRLSVDNTNLIFLAWRHLTRQASTPTGSHHPHHWNPHGCEERIFPTNVHDLGATATDNVMETKSLRTPYETRPSPLQVPDKIHF